MEQPKLTAAMAERIVNLLRDNPGVSQTLADIADATEQPVENVAAYLEDLAGHGLVIHDTTPDGVDVYSFPAEYQRGTT
jgi:DNA-binding IclR family transcriptional regulator